MSLSPCWLARRRCNLESDALRNLYAEDADWNFPLMMLSEASTGKARKRSNKL